MNECRITDIHNYPHAPSFALSASGSQNRSSSRPLHTFLFKPAERFGACFTAQNGGFVNMATFNNQSLTPHATTTLTFPLVMHEVLQGHKKLSHQVQFQTCLHSSSNQPRGLGACSTAQNGGFINVDTFNNEQTVLRHTLNT